LVCRLSDHVIDLKCAQMIIIIGVLSRITSFSSLISSMFEKLFHHFAFYSLFRYPSSYHHGTQLTFCMW